MAKKRTQRRSSRRRSSSASAVASQGGGGDFLEGLKEFVQTPAMRYVLGALATAAVAKIGMNLANRYPEISNLVKEGLDALENKLIEFRNGARDESGQRREDRESMEFKH